ncbi:hypothetical protein [Pseudomonas capeferrum]|nr:hypothetical protein [Pseudomonas capeferrum]
MAYTSRRDAPAALDLKGAEDAMTGTLRRAARGRSISRALQT